MTNYARVLFGIAALFNFSVAAGLIFLREPLAPLLSMDPATGTNVLAFNMAGALIGVFGYAYWRVAMDPVAYRPYVHLGIVGKLLAVIVAAATWITADVSWQLPALAGGDLLFVALFADYLRRTG
jgi:hypothetical protein